MFHFEVMCNSTGMKEGILGERPLGQGMVIHIGIIEEGVD
jgi:hypothetical protein